jgi:hypothetical protein
MKENWRCHLAAGVPATVATGLNTMLVLHMTVVPELR